MIQRLVGRRAREALLAGAREAGVAGLIHYYAAHLAREGITANAIAPGPIQTEMTASRSGGRI